MESWGEMKSESSQLTRFKVTPDKFRVGEWELRAVLDEAEPPVETRVLIEILPIPPPLPVAREEREGGEGRRGVCVCVCVPPPGLFHPPPEERRRRFSKTQRLDLTEAP